MELNLDIIGQEITTKPYSYDWKTCALYALGIGSGTEDLSYTWEGSETFKVIPSFAVIPTQPIVMKALAEARADFRRLVHGAQTITMHQAIPSEGVFQSTGRVTEIQDKVKGAVVIIDTETKDADGTLLFETSWSIFCRGQGDFGGSRGDSVSIPDVSEGAEAVFEKDYETHKDQALLYRLSGDLNPLHVDPNLASKVGFDAPILHGLCTYGVAMRAILEGLCHGDPSRLSSFTARFSQVVFPGDHLAVAIHPSTVSGTYRLEVSVADKVVLSHGVVVIG